VILYFLIIFVVIYLWQVKPDVVIFKWTFNLGSREVKLHFYDVNIIIGKVYILFSTGIDGFLADCIIVISEIHFLRLPTISLNVLC
jgi:hypothetical protein